MLTVGLNGEWTLRNALETETVKAQLPGDNYTALFEAGKIPDPYYGANEALVQWVRKCTWVFERSFEIPANFLSYDEVFLNLEMLDTFAEIRINGKSVLKANNMFVRWRKDVKTFLKEGKNDISITFESPEKIGKERAEKLPFPVPQIGNVQVPFQNLVRKQHCSGGWDWGCAVLSCGVYGDLSLTPSNICRIENVYTEQVFRNEICEVTVCAAVYGYRNAKTKITFSFNGEKACVTANVREEMTNLIKHTFIVAHPERWYPAGYGKQTLYPLEVTLADGNSVRKKIGLRTLEVDTSPDRIGRAMVFKVNNIPVFCKGAAWVPADAMPSRITHERINALLESAVKANMNMLRVWGGGKYESEDFYDLCDEKGILIWQDFMFACSLYPATKEFLAEVEEELDFQIPRLRSHACIALWCGDNEVQGALNWYKESVEDREKYLLNYDRLNQTIARKIALLDPSRVFWPSSPCSGPDCVSDSGWHKDGSGDMHYWEVWFGDKTFDAYYTKKPRFCSEFGFQSFPSLETIESFADRTQLNCFSPVMDVHQKCSKGSAPIIAMFGRYFRMPHGFENFLYLSRIQQALAIRTGIEYWRSIKPVCMGTLFWQLNDNWPVISWSSIEYNGNWKPLQYMVKRSYAPLLVTARPDGENAIVSAVSDLQEEVNGKLVLRFFSLEGKLLETREKTLSLAPLEAKEISTEKLPEGHLKNELYMTLSLETESLSAENIFFFDVFKHCELPETEVKLVSIEEKQGIFELHLLSEKTAFFVWLETPGIRGLFSDNAFTLCAGEEKILSFTPEKPCSAPVLEKSLKIFHLRGTY